MSKLLSTHQGRYLTGMTALNIPSEESHGDWHFREAFFGRGSKKPKIFIAGAGERWNTNAILGSFGVYECSDILRKLGVNIPLDEEVYAANHYRAILDMIYLSIKNQQIPNYIEIDRWFDTGWQKEKLFQHIQKLESHLSKPEQELLEQWLKMI